MTDRAALGIATAALLAAGAVVGSRQVAVPDEVLGAMALLAVAGVIGRRRRWLGAACAIPGAAVVAAEADMAGGAPATAAVAAAVVLIGLGASDLERRWHEAPSRLPAPGWILLGGWACAVALAVPDTEQAIPVAALLAAAAVASAALSAAGVGTGRLGALGWWASAGLLVWIATAGGVGRPGSIVGAIAAAGVLLVEPVVARLVGPAGPRPPSVEASVLLVGAQAAVCLVGARVVADPHDVWAAAVLAAVMLASAVAIGVAAAPVSGAPGRSPGRVVSGAALALVLTVAVAAPAAAEQGGKPPTGERSGSSADATGIPPASDERADAALVAAVAAGAAAIVALGAAAVAVRRARGGPGARGAERSSEQLDVADD